MPSPAITKSAPSIRSAGTDCEATIDAPITDIAHTTATPTMSAAAVDPVRRGSRTALRAASRPIEPHLAGKALVSTGNNRRTRIGLSTTNAADEQTIVGINACMPPAKAPTPAGTRSPVPDSTRRHDDRTGSRGASRNAAIGATLPALRAGA
ncbi:hypothetical protein OG948_57910 (plasmid) [Embleya sp. NBC_00888]|uniref:hypothetical protein n=1 Tax=Embleya sp. NBC_00888 TaxID=2975960 RepID=UPI002F9149DC|nr:hypothetical protein OG948_57910 [Embleya sp. NBC_00888]